MSDSRKTPVITLLTDFGLVDPYVPAVKGVILSLCGDVRLVDVTHSVPPQDVWAGGYIWASCYKYFPEGTIHLGVVDPGVGTMRRPVAARIAGHVFVCPDNGLLSWIAAESPVAEAFELREDAYFMREPSATFHGRDIFAPAAAHIANGVPLSRLGPPADQLFLLQIPQPRKVSERELLGEVIHIDTYGNLVTNIRLADCRELNDWHEADAEVTVGRVSLRGLRRTYSDAPAGESLAYFGSTGRLDIAINMGNAAQSLGIKRGDMVTLSLGGSAQ